MPLFDFEPVTVNHLALFSAGFIMTYGIIWWFLKRPEEKFQPVLTKINTYYAGNIVVAVTVLLAYSILGNSALMVGLIAAACIIVFVSSYDQSSALRPSTQFFWQVVIVTIVVSLGWSINQISHPTTSGVINLAWREIGPFMVPGGLLTIVWLLLLMNAVNWLDGVDGLATGVGAVALLTLAAISLLPSVQDPQTLALALIGAGSFIGFLIWNAPIARVYLGTSGSWFLGLFIGIVAIIGGGKIVTTLLVLAVPIIDFISVIVQRLLAGQAPWIGRYGQHLHYRLLKQGISERATMIGGIAISVILGWLALTLQTRTKLVALIVVSVTIALVTISLAIINSLRLRSK